MQLGLRMVKTISISECAKQPVPGRVRERSRVIARSAHPLPLGSAKSYTAGL